MENEILNLINELNIIKNSFDYYDEFDINIQIIKINAQIEVLKELLKRVKKMKVEKYYCDICNKELLKENVEGIYISKKHYDLCYKCRKDLQIKTLEYLQQMKQDLIKVGDKKCMK